MQNTTKTFVFRDIPVSKQGQITLPKTVRERLGINLDSSKKIAINILLKETSDKESVVVIEATPTIDDVFGILETSKNNSPVAIQDYREALAIERSRELGYSPAND